MKIATELMVVLTGVFISMGASIYAQGPGPTPVGFCEPGETSLWTNYVDGDGQASDQDVGVASATAEDLAVTDHWNQWSSLDIACAISNGGLRGFGPNTTVYCQYYPGLGLYDCTVTKTQDVECCVPTAL